MERVVEGGVGEDRVIPVNSVEMYEVIANFEKEIGVHRIARCREDFRQWYEKHIRRIKSSVNHIKQ